MAINREVGVPRVINLLISTGKGLLLPAFSPTILI
jgi:hypothetical protein